MNGMDEPTVTISRPEDISTPSRMDRVDSRILRKLNTVLSEVLENGLICEHGESGSEELLAETMGLLGRISDTLARAGGLPEKQSFKETEAKSSSETGKYADESDILAFSLACVSDAIFIVDKAATVIACNGAAEKLCDTSAERLRGKLVSEILTLIDESTLEECHDPSADIFAGDKPRERRCTMSIEGMAERTVIVRGEVMPGRDGEVRGMALIIRDCTRQEQLEEELLRIRKLESVGMLAGGIAHDFNNILTGIITNLFMARMSACQNEEACNLIADAEKAAFRATRLTKQLLTFSQGGAPVKEKTSVGQLIEETVGFSLSGSNVDYKLHFSEELHQVEVDKGQIDQVLHNLIMNAAQAMPEGGTVTISAENWNSAKVISQEDRSPVPTEPLMEGEYVRISVRDEGPGIPRKHLGKIFDPYFSTKEGGSGLGLTIAYSIVKKHGGHMEVESQPGHGSVFSFYIPAIIDMESEEKSEPVIQSIERGNILVMDDDVIIRTVVDKLLKKSGYNVVSVTNGSDALQAYIDAFNRGKRFEFVIMDLTIPGGMGGKETVLKMKEFDRNAKVIVFSGYSNDPILTNYRDYGFDGVLRKPFSTDELIRLIQNIG